MREYEGYVARGQKETARRATHKLIRGIHLNDLADQFGMPKHFLYRLLKEYITTMTDEEKQELWEGKYREEALAAIQ